eukprot:3571209-Amphidinium_carterae.1
MAAFAQLQVCANLVSRLRLEIAEASPGAPPSSPAPLAVQDSFLQAAPAVAQLDTPTQELLRLALAHGYNCAAVGAASPALDPEQLAAPTTALVSTLVTAPPLPPPPTQVPCPAPLPATPAHTALDTLQTQQAVDLVHTSVSQVAACALQGVGRKQSQSSRFQWCPQESTELLVR